VLKLMEIGEIGEKRCQYLRWEGYGQFMKSLLDLSEKYYAGIMVPFYCQVCGNLCDQTQNINSQSSFGRQKMKKRNYN
jgi:hypothetical protein